MNFGSNKVFESVKDLRRFLSLETPAFSGRAFIPTMGALHEGHLSLIENAWQYGSPVIASIFVNPTQFGPGEDFNSYPRKIQEDVEKLEDLVDAIFIPNLDEIYKIKPYSELELHHDMTQILCAESRPTHFGGVCTVLLKLLNIVQPNTLILGQKDFQQFRITCKLIEDFHLPSNVVAMPTIREESGLALSSRNNYLSSEEKEAAQSLYKALSSLKEGSREGNPVDYILDLARKELSPKIRLDYFEVRDQINLEEQKDFNENSRAFIAGKIGSTRLIDNLALFGNSEAITFKP